MDYSEITSADGIKAYHPITRLIHKGILISGDVGHNFIAQISCPVKTKNRYTEDDKILTFSKQETAC